MRPLPVQDRDTSQHLSCAAGKKHHRSFSTGRRGGGGGGTLLPVCVCVCVKQLEHSCTGVCVLSVLTIIIIIKSINYI